MKRILPIISLAMLASAFWACSCRSEAADVDTHEEHRGVYYWKTSLDADSADMEFLKRHNIGRIYVRMFDVDVDSLRVEGVKDVVPTASLRVPEKCMERFSGAVSSRIEFVPVVYVTQDAMRSTDNIGTLAANIFGRVRAMCQYNELPHVSELQLDCDWTSGTRPGFFALCDSVKSLIRRDSLDWKLSSTIRLHQLSQSAPPVDRGVLMVYNTGSYNNPDEPNSIISVDAVKRYVGRLGDYPLHLDVAYPTYSWQLLFRNRQFSGIISGASLRDTTAFRRVGENCYEALRDMAVGNNKAVLKGDMVRCETSGYQEVMKVKSLIEKELATKPHSTILYHFDLSNLNKYSSDEIDDMLR